MSTTYETHLDCHARPWDDLGKGVKRQILGHGPQLMMARFTFEAGAIGAPHSHPHVQAALVEKGVFDVTIDGVTRRLVAGDSYYVPSNVVHGVVAIEAGILVDCFTPTRADFLG